MLCTYLANVWAIPSQMTHPYNENEGYEELKDGITIYLQITCIVAGILDGIFALNTPYYSKGVFVNERIHIIKHYFRNSFLLDVFAIGPIILTIQNYSNHIFWNAFFFFLIFKIKKIIAQIEDHFHFQEKTQAFLNLLKLLTQIMTIAHFFACFWIYLAFWEVNNLKFNNTWIQNFQLEDKTWEIKYINSLYYSIVTMVTVGYGDISPQNYVEKAFAVIIIIIACGFFAYALNRVGQILIEMNRSENEIKLKEN